MTTTEQPTTAARTRRPNLAGSLIERPPGSGKWYLRVFVGADPVTGKPRQVAKTVSARNKTEAGRLLNAWIAELADQPRPDTTATVRVLIDEWLRHLEGRGRAPRTIQTSRESADNVICPELGAVRVADLTPHVIDTWCHHLLSGDGRVFADDDTRARSKASLSASSVRRHFGVLSSALGQAVKWGWITANPCARATPPEVAEQELVVPTVHEVQQLLAAATKRDPRWGMLMALALSTAARRGELCALRWNDIDGDRITISKSAYRAGEVRGEKSTKTGRARVVVVGPATVALLEGWRTRCHEEAALLGVELATDAYVVSPWPTGERRVNPDTFSSVVHVLASELGIPHVHLHSLRHFAATELIGSGVNVRDAAGILGHANPALTLRTYAHPTSERQRQAAAVLDRVHLPTPGQGLFGADSG